MKKSTKMILSLAAILLVGFALILALAPARKKSEKLSIVATNFPAFDFARAVAGDRAEIKMLIRPGVETHDFEPTPSDIIDIKNSQLFVFVGGESDDWVENILNDLDVEKTKIFKMMDSVALVEEEITEGMEGDSDEKEYDEHVWTSLKNAQKIVNGIKTELINISPENKDFFEENAKNYLEKLKNLDAEFEKIVRNGNRKTLVFGDRFPFRYLVDDYGLDYFAAFPGCSEQTEASSQTLAFLVDKIKSENIPVVLKIEQSSSKIARTLSDATGAKILTLNSAHTVSADDFKSGKTYVDLMTENLKVLEEALK